MFGSQICRKRDIKQGIAMAQPLIKIKMPPLGAPNCLKAHALPYRLFSNQQFARLSISCFGRLG